MYGTVMFTKFFFNGMFVGFTVVSGANGLSAGYDFLVIKSEVFLDFMTKF
jgi:hypothetical protein